MIACFAAVTPGLEGLLARELSQLGRVSSPDPKDAHRPAGEGGGLLFEGELEALYRANLHLRVASRVLVRLGEFYAAAFSELHKKSGRLEWERFLSPGQPVRIHVTCHKSRLYHSGAVAQRVAAGIANRLGEPSPVYKGQDETPGPAQLVVVRLVHDKCTLSIDSSGELLHRRGYRLGGAKAPLRETLAAGMLLAAEWDPNSPLLDPFCGSGTIAIEAAQIALGLPPGRNRRFAFMDWPGYEPQLWERVLEAGSQGRKEMVPSIQASDRDAGAVQTALENARRAGVAGAIGLTRRALSSVEPPAGPGWVVANPPYGVRVGQEKDLRDLYAQLGNVLRRSCPGWQVALLGSDPVLFGQVGFRLEPALSTINGGLNVRLMRGQVPGG